MKRVNVEIWSDFACPWCWIAKRRFDKAVRGLAGQIEVVVTPRAYRLAKGMAPADYQNVLNQKFGNAAAAEKMMAAAVFEKALLDAAIDVPEPLDDGAGASCSINGCAI